MKVKISFPQIVIESKEVEVSEEKYEELVNEDLKKQADFVWQNMTEQEQDWSNGKKWIEDAMDVGYCKIARIQAQ